MLATLEKSKALLPAHNSERELKTMLLYTMNIELSMCFSLSLHDQFKLYTTSDPEMLLIYAGTVCPDLVVLDAHPSERIRHQCEIMKRTNPGIRIIFYCSSRFERSFILNMIRPYTDVLLFEPVNFLTLMDHINALYPKDT